MYSSCALLGNTKSGEDTILGRSPQETSWNTEFNTPHKLVTLQRIVDMGFGCFVYAVTLKISVAIPDKTKLRVKYWISGNHRNVDILEVSHYKHESGCLQQCCHLPKCSAYNDQQNGTCQLLPPTNGFHVLEDLKVCVLSTLLTVLAILFGKSTIPTWILANNA